MDRTYTLGFSVKYITTELYSWKNITKTACYNIKVKIHHNFLEHVNILHIFATNACNN